MFADAVRELCREEYVSLGESWISMTFVSCGWISGDEVTTCCKALSTRNSKCWKAGHAERGFFSNYLQARALAPLKSSIHGVIMIKGTEDSEPEVWFARKLLLLCLKAGWDVEEMRVAFVQFMKVIPLLDDSYQTLWYVRVRWYTSVGNDYSVTKYVPTE